ncbi:hypothetical protein HO831_02360 [Streptococcus suis]|uniref:Uncharacterized protein n=1 Tax=Streptococcus suis TaxID=1307 RepID=A0A116MW81_STRSU|nr:hypothetical protein [Streptococcus suis]QBX21721.1 hypothetical protein Javan589_0044 [Streptococcus phage Javan589]QBX30631.1 hypothetical protein Javan562_0009 [Streptococcus phage Javan562]QBX30720.1 hypothetical protein Javan566_0045 [Streptococcus phage Javan566]AGZ23787.1 hypothetical protein T15_1702 [Streptococcus suis T15]MCB2951088.1 hypothetical protein [Streptococcus suis]
MTETLFDAIVSVSVFALPMLVVAVAEQRKLEKQRKEREAKLIREQLTALACERAVEADRQAWKNRVKQSLASWEPIKFADDASTRTARKWGRHAG